MSGDAVLCCGILSKLGGVPVARLQRRYFELRESGAFVYYPESSSNGSSSSGGSGAATIMPALRHATAAASVSPLGSSPPSSSSSSHAHLHHHPHHSAGGVELGEPNGVIYTVGAKIVDRGTYYGKPCFSLEGVNLAKGVKEYFFFADDRESKWKWYQALQIVSGSSFYQKLRVEREQNEDGDDEGDEVDEDESNDEEGVRQGHNNIDCGDATEKEVVTVGGGCNALPSHHHHPTQQREDAGSPLPSSSSAQHNNKRTPKSPSPSVSKLMCQSPLYAKFGNTKEFRRCADCSSRHPTWSVFVPNLPALVFQRRQRNANSPRRTATPANEPQEGDHRPQQQEPQHASVDPLLASATTAALFVCIHCVGVHRSLWAGRCRGVELDKYTEAEVQCFERTVGQHINEYLEFACPPLSSFSSSSSLPSSHSWKKPCRQSTRTLREQYIKAKYEQRLFSATDAEWIQYVEERKQRRAAKQQQQQQQNAGGTVTSTPGATEQQQHQRDVPPFGGVATDENGEESSAFGGGDHHDAQPPQATSNASSYSSAVVPSATSTSSGHAAAASLRSYCPPPQDVVERVPPSDRHPYINDLLAAFATPLPQYIGIVHVALRELEGCHSSYTSSSISGIVAVLTNGCQEVRSSPSLKGEKRGTTWRSSGSLSPRGGGSSSSASSTTLQLGVDHLERPLFLTFYENNGEGKIAGTAMFSLSSLSSSNEAAHHHQPQPPQHPKKDWGEDGMREVSLRVEGRMAGDGSGVVLVQLGVSFLRLA